MNRPNSLVTSTIQIMSAHTQTPTSINNKQANSQFKHTILWNNIINDLKKNLIEDSTNIRSTVRSASCSSASSSNLIKSTPAPVPVPPATASHVRIRRQHSRFLAAGVGPMLLIKQNLMNNSNGNSIENFCFTGSKCVDIVYDFLTSKEQSHNFERQITREKVSKLCQSLMDSGVFESISKNCTKFDDTILKVYRFKPPKNETSPQNPIENDKENTNNQNVTEGKIAFNKNENTIKIDSITKSSKSISTNSKIKKKLISMRRCSTVQTLLPVVDYTGTASAENNNADILAENNFKNKEFVARQIKKELIVEKLLTLIDLPLIENLLLIDQLSSKEQESNRCVTNLKSKSASCLEKLAALSILTQTYDATKCDDNDEWKKSAHECLEYLNWELIWQQMQSEKEQQDNEQQKDRILQSSKINNKYSLVSALYNPITPHRSTTSSSRQQSAPKLNSISHIDTYNLIKEYYKNRNKFLDASFQPLFTHILLFLRQTHYNKALEALNLGTLLLHEQTQAELKRLLKFLYLTANTSTAPRLSENKPNNSILLNHFADCLFNTKLIGFEETRLILNFMMNNFDDLFKINKSIEESFNKRCLIMKKYGHEEHVMEKLYCKQMTSQEFDEKSKEDTTKALVDLINHIVDDPQISLKQKKLKLRALQRIHPDIYEKNFADLQY